LFSKLDGAIEKVGVDQRGIGLAVALVLSEHLLDYPVGAEALLLSLGRSESLLVSDVRPHEVAVRQSHGCVSACKIDPLRGVIGVQN
jgi:hypothetical protein